MMHRQFAEALHNATAFVLNMVDQVGRATGLDRMEWDPEGSRASSEDSEPEESGPRPVFWSQTELSQPIEDGSVDQAPLSLELVRGADRVANQNVTASFSLLNTLGRPITQGEIALFEFVDDDSPVDGSGIALLDFDEDSESPVDQEGVALLDFDDVYPLEEDGVALLEFLDDDAETTVGLRPLQVDTSGGLLDEEPFELTKTYAAAAFTRPKIDDRERG